MSQAELTATYYLAIAGTALSYYDFLLDLNREIDLIWRQRFTPVTILFIISRYSGLALVTWVALGFAMWNSSTIEDSVSRCNIESWIFQVVMFLNLSSAAVSSAMRVWALSGRNRCQSTLAFLLGISPPVILLYAFSRVLAHPTTTKAMNFPYLCRLKTHDDGVVLWGTVIRATSILADIFVVFVTYLNTRHIGRHMHTEQSISDIVLHDGCAYFGALMVVNLLGLIFSRNMRLNELATFWVELLTPVLLCRFTLDLRYWAQVGAVPSGFEPWSTIDFADANEDASERDCHNQSGQAFSSISDGVTIV